MLNLKFTIPQSKVSHTTGPTDKITKPKLVNMNKSNQDNL